MITELNFGFKSKDFDSIQMYLKYNKKKFTMHIYMVYKVTQI